MTTVVTRPIDEARLEAFVGRVQRLFRPGSTAHLVGEWLPALNTVVEKLQAGASVVNVGCGLGASTIIMAEAFEHSTFVGIDINAPSIAAARKAAAEAGVSQRVRFDIASAKQIPGTGHDLVCLFGCLHAMNDPGGAARAIRQSLAPDGTLLLVDPQEAVLGLGMQAGVHHLGVVLREAGLTRVRRATQTPFNLIAEARP